MSVIGRRRRFIINIIYFAMIVGLMFLAFRYIPGLLWPFLAAFAFAWMLRPAARWIAGRTRLPYKLANVLCVVLLFAVLGLLIFLLGSRLLTAAQEFVASLPAFYKDVVAPGLDRLSETVGSLAAGMGPAASELVGGALPGVSSSISEGISRLSEGMMPALAGAAAALPRTVLSLLVCVIATFFFALDFDRVTAFLMRQFPERTRSVVRQTKNAFVTVVVQYVKSYGIILLITFGEILAGLLILGQKNAGLIAAIIAVFDIFPIVGAWMALVPWAIIELMAGSVKMGVGLIILWIVEVVVRQFIEPRIVGHHVGLHPIVTLLAMYIGARLFGGVGLFGLPITCAIIYSLDRAGVIHILKRGDSSAAQSQTE